LKASNVENRLRTAFGATATLFHYRKAKLTHFLIESEFVESSYTEQLSVFDCFEEATRSAKSQ